MPTFFISHAVADKKLVPAFVDLLHTGMNINFNDILCTSNGNLQTGDLFINEIRTNIYNSDVIIFLLSPNFFKSRFCLCEMGAAWMLGRYIVPIMVTPSNFSELESTPLKGLQARRIHIKEDLYEIFNEFLKIGALDNPNINRFVSKLDEFLKKRPWLEHSTLITGLNNPLINSTLPKAPLNPLLRKNPFAD